MAFVNLHRHSSYSLFDGGATPKQAAVFAQSIGQQALGLTDHGTISGLIEHYEACRELKIKPVLGVEAYFQPKFDKTRKRYHLTLLVESVDGYMNMNKLLTVANRDNFYRTGNVDLELLKTYNQGIIVLSGCLAGYIPRLIDAGEIQKAIKMINRFRRIFTDRFYLEVQPYEAGNQHKINEFLLDYAEKHDIPVAATVDSHYCGKKDYDTYKVMYEMSGKGMPTDYSMRYMPTDKEVRKAWKEFMGTDPTEYVDETERIAERCNVELDFADMIPRLDWGVPSRKKLTQIAVSGLKQADHWNTEYKKRLKYELDIVLDKKFEDYFLLCYDIVNFARSSNIPVGYGRGSVCGSLLAYAIGLTNIDPIALDIRFEKFLHQDKNSLPDIDLDFDSSRRGEIISYILQKYQGKSAPITTFGYYKVKNLINDLAKVYKMEDADRDTLKKVLVEYDKQDATEVDYDELIMNRQLRRIDSDYPDIVKHFSRLFGQPKYIGRHAAGVAICNDDIDKYAALQNIRGELQTGFDLGSLEKLKILKMDILGLETVSKIRDIERLVNVSFSYDKLDDPKVYKRFAGGDTLGIFHFEKSGAIEILEKVQPINIQELTACIALNRPAPIKLGIVDEFVSGKNGYTDRESIWYKYTKDTYGTIVYQEHVMAICRYVAKMEWKDVDYILKLLKKPGQIEKHPDVKETFVQGAVAHSGMQRADAGELFDKMTLYLFNKAHGIAYSITAYWLMWLKTYYPLEFWYATLKHAKDDYNREVYKSEAVKGGVLIWLPHVNGTATYTIKEVDGEKVIQEGMSSIRHVGTASAQIIEELGSYEDETDFLYKVPKRSANSRVVEALKEAGALEFNEAKYLDRVTRYNSALYAKRLKIR